jgi:ABC-2 type transport system ATP-binding protein/lipopolysaccharide transport system ATP-binding protein
MSDLSEARILAENVNVQLPLFDQSRSIRKTVFNSFVGGGVSKRGSNLVVNALTNLNLDIQAGDRVGVIGPNGSGKTTLLRLLAGAYGPSSGRLEIAGRISPLLAIGTGMDFDETGYNNIRSCCLLLGVPPSKIPQLREEIAEFTELGDYLDVPVRLYSSGMMIRLSFAIATSIDPEILLIDEIFGAGDARFAQKARARMDHLIANATIMVLASHSDSIIRQFCNKGLFLRNGETIAYGDVDDTLAAYHEWLKAES